MSIKNLSILFVFLLQGLFAGEPLQKKQVLATIPALEQIVLEGMQASHVPGLSIAITLKDEVVYLKGFGVREAGKSEPVTSDTVFQLASVSKPLTATVLAALVTEGKVRWDSSIRDLDPSFQLSDPWVTQHIKIEDLLAHRSGLFDHAGDLLEDLGYDRKTIIHQLRFIKRLYPFRAHYAYTNFGFSEAAFAAANYYEKDWNQIAFEKLFKPLGMRHSSYSYRDFLHTKNRAPLHRTEKEGLLSISSRNPDAQAPAGGACSSARDLSKWMLLLLNKGQYQRKELMSEKALFTTQTPKIVSQVNRATDQIGFYGLGWGISYNSQGKKVLSHSGAFAVGARTQVVLIPEEEIGIVVLTNSAMHGLPEAVTQSFFDLVHDGKVEKDWIAIWNERMKSLDPLPRVHPKPLNYVAHIELDRYTGSFYNDYFGQIEITKNPAGLELVIGPKNMKFSLRHYTKDTFIMDTVGENAVGESKVIFFFDNSGKPKRVEIDYLNDQRLGVFIPVVEGR